jgi:hypothetical protein
LAIFVENPKINATYHRFEHNFRSSGWYGGAFPSYSSVLMLSGYVLISSTSRVKNKEIV